MSVSRSVSAASAVSEIARKRIDEINLQIEDIAASVRDIADAKSRHNLEAKLVVVKSKKQRLRTMASIAKLLTIQAELDIIVAGTEIGLELADLKRSRDWDSDLGGGKRVKLSEEKRRDNIRSSSKHTLPKATSSKKSQKGDAKSKKSDIKISAEVQNIPPLKSSTPIKKNDDKKSKTQHDDRTKVKPASKKPVSKSPCAVGKSMIFLEHPPIKDQPLMANNVGYYTSDYARQYLGYVPKDLHFDGGEKENIRPRNSYEKSGSNQINSTNDNRQFSIDRISTQNRQVSDNKLLSNYQKKPKCAIKSMQKVNQTNQSLSDGQKPINCLQPLWLTNPKVSTYEDHLKSASFQPQSIGFYQQQTDFNQQPTGFNQQPNFYQQYVCNKQSTEFNSQSIGFNPQAFGFYQQSTVCNQQSMSSHQQSTVFNQKSTVFNGKSSNYNRKNQILAEPSQIAGSRDMEGVHEKTTNRLFKEIMDNKLINVKTDNESISSITTLIIQTL